MRLSLAALILLLCTLTVSASHLNGIDPPGSLLVTRNGYEWAWASPCAPEDPSCGTPLIMHHGFSVATGVDWVRDFVDQDDVFAAFNPGGQLCASAYFNSGYDHCDNANVNGVGANIAIWNAPWGVGNVSYAESFVLRRAVVPEPGTWALLAAGIAALGLRKKLS